MNIVKMNQFGVVLTGRDFGKKAMHELNQSLKIPATLDFSGVTSLGSSFGDEVVPVIANLQGGVITVLNVSKAVYSCLAQIADEHKIQIIRDS